MSFSKFTLGALLAVAATSACEAVGSFQGGRLQQSAPTPAPPPGAPPAGAPPAAPPPAGSTAGADALFRRLGAEVGLQKVMTDFVGRAAKDPKINGYFLNTNVLPERVIACLVIQAGALTGGPYTYPSSGCRDMKTVHTGLKISAQDFADTAAHLVAAMTAAGVAQADINTIVTAVMGTANDIIEDRTNNATVYQRVGRKPAIEAVVRGFIDAVAADTRINAFFTGGNPERLATCLVRQVCGIDGPCRYGLEVDEPGVSKAAPCKDMLTVHRGINNPRPITKADFDAVVEVLVGVLDRAGVAAADKNALLGALGPACKDIVADGLGC